MKLLVYLPARNAGKTLFRTVSSIPHELFNRISGILIVNNASVDNTKIEAEKVKSSGLPVPVTVINNETDKGYGGSQKIAYRYAIDNGYDAVVMLHADGQYPPDKSVELAESLFKNKGDGKGSGADMCIGSRVASGSKTKMPFWRFVGNRVLTAVEAASFRLGISEYHSGFRAYRCATLAKTNFEKCSNSYPFDTEMFAIFAANGFKVIEIPVTSIYSKDSNTPKFIELVEYCSTIFLIVGEFVLYKYKLRKDERFGGSSNV